MTSHSCAASSRDRQPHALWGLVDVAILTVLEVEEKAVTTCLQLDEPTIYSLPGGLRLTYGKRKNRHGQYLRVAIVRVPRQGNTMMAFATTLVQTYLLPKLAVLVGIAAGLKKGPSPQSGKPIKGLSIGTVVMPRVVVDYSFAAIKTIDELVTEEPRHKAFEVGALAAAIETAVQGADLIAFRDCRDRVMSEVTPDWAKDDGFKSFPLPNDRSPNNWNAFLQEFVVKPSQPAFTDDDLASSNLLLRNETVLRALAERHPRVKAADMESAGFASANAELKTEWFVVRGISDLGDDQKSDVFHEYAAASASALLSIALERLNTRSLGAHPAEERRKQDLESAKAHVKLVLDTFVTTFHDQIGAEVNLELYWTGEGVLSTSGGVMRIQGVIRDGDMKAERAGYLNRLQPRRFFPFSPKRGEARAVARAADPALKAFDVFHVIGPEERTPLKWVYALPVFDAKDHGAAGARVGALCCTGVQPLVRQNTSPDEQDAAKARLKAMVGGVRDLVASVALITGLFDLVPREVELDTEP
jgi:nucleoside phosphorylase